MIINICCLYLESLREKIYKTLFSEINIAKDTINTTNNNNSRFQQYIIAL